MRPLKRIRVDVTQSNIVNGKRGEETSCPIALALIDNGFSNPSVGPDDGEALDQFGNEVSFDLSKGAQEFISEFDLSASYPGTAVYPRVFYLTQH